MASRDDPYSRVYHRFSDEFPSVFDDDRAVAAWLRLLLIADAAWPTRPPIPATVNRKALTVLQGAGLVLVERGHYTMLGLSKQRTERRARAVAAGVARAEQTLSRRSAFGEPNQTEPNRDKPRLDETVNGTERAARGVVEPMG